MLSIEELFYEMLTYERILKQENKQEIQNSLLEAKKEFMDMFKPIY